MTPLDDAEPRPPIASLRVLVVEDEPLIAMVLEDYLADLGCTVVGPFSKLGAALAAAGSEPIDIALLDVNITGGTSYAVADVLGSNSVPFAFMTGQDARDLPPSSGAVGNLAKPYSDEDVARVVGELRNAMRAGKA